MKPAKKTEAEKIVDAMIRRSDRRERKAMPAKKKAEKKPEARVCPTGGLLVSGPPPLAYVHPDTPIRVLADALAVLGFEIHWRFEKKPDPQPRKTVCGVDPKKPKKPQPKKGR